MKKGLGVVLLVLSSTLLASEAEVEAEKLLEISGTRAAMDGMMELLLKQQLQQNPSMQPYKDIMQQFYRKHLSYENLKADYIKLYTSEFSADELAQINAFYQTPVGRKAVQKLPVLMQRGSEIGVRRVRQHLGELQQMIRQEAERLNAQNKP